ncbi:MAG: hypothetical protein GY868_16005 [Deltaproteobacteria bacterium]|nr:hypothetical protein [Deltaproteobacteria bacterium]
MELSKIVELLEAELLTGHDKLLLDITTGFGTDLMSDMLHHATDGVLLLTGLTNVQVLRSSVISGVSAVAFVRGKYPHAEIIAQAREHDLPLLVTPFTMFTSCGKLFVSGISGIDEKVKP